MMMSTAGKAISRGEAFSVPSSSFPKGDDPPLIMLQNFFHV
ncbi:hypothetical protein [Lysinibacillus capsici]|nr:hypothetical protein [Lysinibacillus capsici]